MVVRNQRIGHQHGIPETHARTLDWYCTIVIKGFGDLETVVLKFKNSLHDHFRDLARSDNELSKYVGYASGIQRFLLHLPPFFEFCQ